jgi:hypothetical protein
LSIEPEQFYTAPPAQSWPDRFEQKSLRVAPALEALDFICGDRENDYGGLENFTRLSQRWSQVFDRQVEPWEVCLMMMDLKLSRLINQYKRDSVVDIIGYACLLCELYDDANKGPNSLSDEADRGAEAHPIKAD